MIDNLHGEHINESQSMAYTLSKETRAKDSAVFRVGVAINLLVAQMDCDSCPFEVPCKEDRDAADYGTAAHCKRTIEDGLKSMYEQHKKQG